MATLTTPRLLLRPWREEDADTLFRWAQNPAVGPIAGWPAHRSPEESREIIRTVFSAPETYAIVLREEMIPIGAIAIKSGEGLSPSLRGTGDAELGYWLAEEYWGRGLMTEAARAIIERAFGTLGYRRLWCGYYEGNERSRRVMEKCGFKPHHTEHNKPTLLGDTRTEHFMRVER
ncbi:MAG: GNAT family N-acetyltransferase [Tidjanibacter sp.]|nr:GNAT family N-acetyltransferase [Tidjanibacter sp.]